MKKLIASALIISIIIALFTYSFGDTTNTSTDDNVSEVRARVLEVDNSDIISSHFSNIGYQSVRIKILDGKYKGNVIDATNTLLGSNDYDEIYAKGDTIIAAIKYEEEKLVGAKTISRDRRNWLLIMCAVLVVALVAYAHFIGVKAILSFGLSLMVIWQFLIKGLLEGKDPIMLTTVTVILLSAIIIFLVSGFTKRGISAFLGTITGLLITLIITHIFGQNLYLFGMTQPYVQTLIIQGHFDINLREVFYAAIILGASGAAMDISVDIAASIHEIKEQKPDITTKALIQSGFNVGRQVIGTMATTLLLAYSGSYLTLLMLFMSKDTSLVRMMNMKIVAAEVMRTIIGSLGLVMVAPVTAIIAGSIIGHQKIQEKVTEEVIAASLIEE